MTNIGFAWYSTTIYYDVTQNWVQFNIFLFHERNIDYPTGIISDPHFGHFV